MWRASSLTTLQIADEAGRAGGRCGTRSGGPSSGSFSFPTDAERKPQAGGQRAAIFPRSALFPTVRDRIPQSPGAITTASGPRRETRLPRAPAPDESHASGTARQPRGRFQLEGTGTVGFSGDGDNNGFDAVL